MGRWALICSSQSAYARRAFHRFTQLSADWMSEAWEALRSETAEQWESQYEDADPQISAFRLSDDSSGINPATGLPMAGELDVAGNPYGTDLTEDAFGSESWDNDIHDSGSSFGDW